jgi:hypothetical protein
VEICQPFDEALRASHQPHELRHILRHEKAVQPRAAFVCVISRVEVAAVLLVDGAARPSVLVSPRPIHQPRHHEPLEFALQNLAVRVMIYVVLIGVPQVFPVSPSPCVLLGIGIVA